jgi:CRISPR-associated exonuclease Cas4
MTSLRLLDVLWVMLGALALLGGWLALRQAKHARHRAGLPAGRVVYADTGDWRTPDAPFFSAAYGLTGKPDYLVETRAGLIPVEVKSSAAPSHPYASHVLQLAAYCLLVEESEGHAPPHGLIKYADAVFEVAYTPMLRGELLELLDAMRRWRSQRPRHGRAGGAPRSHEEPQRCAGCGYRPMCDQTLV